MEKFTGYVREPFIMKQIKWDYSSQQLYPLV